MTFNTLSAHFRKVHLIIVGFGLILIVVSVLLAFTFPFDSVGPVNTDAWLSYHNDACGYSFKYPPTWHIRETPWKSRWVRGETNCNRVDVVSPDAPRMYSNGPGPDDYVIFIEQYDRSPTSYSLYESIYRVCGRGVPPPTIQILSSSRHDLSKAILHDLCRNPGLDEGVISTNTRAYTLSITPPDTGHTEDDIQTFSGVMVTFTID